MGKASDWLREERRKVLGALDGALPGLRRGAALVRATPSPRCPSACPGCGGDVDPPLSGLLRAVLVDLRGRLRGVRRGSCASRSSSASRSAGPNRASNTVVAQPARARELEAEAGADRREADHRDRVLVARRPGCRAGRGSGAISSARRISGLSCSISRGESSREALHLDPVDHRVEDVLARPVAGADEHRDDHPLRVLVRLVAEPDRRGLPVRAELRLDDRRVEVEGERRHVRPRSYALSASAAKRLARPSPARRA